MKWSNYIILILQLYCSSYSAQTKSDSIYFFQNSVIIENSQFGKADFLRVGLTDSLCKYIFMGEVHYQTSNINIFKNNFTCLNTYNNCNIVALEDSYSDEERLNNYITTGDTNILELYHRRWNKDEAVKLDSILRCIRRIYLLKNQLIKIYCIDAEKMPTNALLDLQDIFSKKQNKIPSMNVKVGIDYLNKMVYKKRRSQKDMRKFVSKMISIMDLYENEYKSYLENDIGRFRNIIKGLAITNRKKSSFRKREDILYSNFKRVITENPNQLIYSQLGSWHTTLLTDTAFANTKNLVQRLCIKDSLKSKICSIYPLYYKNAFGDYFFERERTELLNLGGNKMTLLRLDGENTKYKNFIDLFKYILIIP